MLRIEVRTNVDKTFVKRMIHEYTLHCEAIDKSASKRRFLEFTRDAVAKFGTDYQGQFGESSLSEITTRDEMLELNDKFNTWFVERDAGR